MPIKFILDTDRPGRAAEFTIILKGHAIIVCHVNCARAMIYELPNFPCDGGVFRMGLIEAVTHFPVHDIWNKQNRDNDWYPPKFSGSVQKDGLK